MGLGGPAPTEAAPALAELSARELEVLRLLARDLSNAEIADELTIGEGPVKTHVARVLRKLPAGRTSRAEPPARDEILAVERERIQALSICGVAARLYAAAGPAAVGAGSAWEPELAWGSGTAELSCPC